MARAFHGVEIISVSIIHHRPPSVKRKMKPEEDRGKLFAGHIVLRSESAVAAAEDDAVGGRPFDAVGVSIRPREHP